MFTGLYWCVLICAGVYWFLLVCAGVYWFVLICNWFLLVCTSTYWFLLACTVMYWFVLVCTWSRLVHTGIILVCKCLIVKRLSIASAESFGFGKLGELQSSYCLSVYIKIMERTHSPSHQQVNCSCLSRISKFVVIILVSKH